MEGSGYDEDADRKIMIEMLLESYEYERVGDIDGKGKQLILFDKVPVGLVNKNKIIIIYDRRNMDNLEKELDFRDVLEENEIDYKEAPNRFKAASSIRNFYNQYENVVGDLYDSLIERLLINKCDSIFRESSKPYPDWN